MSTLSKWELKQLIDYARLFTGIAMDESKAYLFESRLKPVMARFNMTSYGQLIAALSETGESAVDAALIDAITTNETYFFRDVHPFVLLKNKLLPDLLARDTSSVIRICSAACSTGQEAYSIAMVLDSLLPELDKTKVRIEAYDVSEHVLKVAQKGEYSKFEVERGLSAELIRRYFTRTDNRFQISDRLRSLVYCHKLNLLKPLGPMPRFDIIFCRNVINYFDVKDREFLIEQLAGILAPKGRLVIGATESLYERSSQFSRHISDGSCYYEKVE